MDTTASARDVYLDLDRLVRLCGLTDTQKNAVQKLLMGYSPSDIAVEEGCRTSTIHNHLNRAVEKIVAENNRHWCAVYGK